MEKGVTNKTKAKVAKKSNKVIKSVEVVQSLPQVKCKYCHESFAEGLPICPHCRRSNKSQTGKIVIAVLAVILLLCIIASHFVEKYQTGQISENDYKYNCVLVSYEDLVRNTKEYKGKDVKLIGKVIEVLGYDFDFGNNISVTMNINLFDETIEKRVVFDYVDKDYSSGLIEGDIITVYGKFTAINGNTPQIDAKYIVFGT